MSLRLLWKLGKSWSKSGTSKPSKAQSPFENSKSCSKSKLGKSWSKSKSCSNAGQSKLQEWLSHSPMASLT